MSNIYNRSLNERFLMNNKDWISSFILLLLVFALKHVFPSITTIHGSRQCNDFCRPPFANSLSRSVHPCTLLDASFCAAKTSLPRGTSGIRAASEKPFCVSLLKIGEADTRHEQKLPAGTFKNVLPCTFLNYEFLRCKNIVTDLFPVHPWTYWYVEDCQ